ncbi:MAG TPA: metal-dependent transcriptional regulator [Kiritimatiellia bacterium]|nr:metal-dependent transcriptional regulator [Kiritimatiellia bacterium]HMO99222.1 metal-dependent transcriptional regulator [Kiritimatiellia bacterium]HMP97490.1 metal-dependent transcriptional regulator [Kiritimatiellia bacterium]
MTKEVWKSFDENTLTHSAAHYLMTIHELLEAQGYARVTDIAKQLNITRGSCSISLKPLKKRGLVVEDHNKFLLLSEEGQRLARVVEKNDELLEVFFKEVLGVNDDQAEVDACKIEHLLSIETSIKLCSFIELMKSDEKVVREFKKVLSKQTQTCQSSVEECPACSQTCFFEQPVVPRKTRKALAAL